MSLSLLDHYYQVCQKANEQPNQELVATLEKLQDQAPSESAHPSISFEDEIAFYQRIEGHWNRENITPADKHQRCERVDQIIKVLQELQIACRDCCQNSEGVVDLVKQLIQYKHPKVEEFFEKVIAPYCHEQLRQRYSKEFTGVINKINQAELEIFLSYLKEPLFVKLSKNNKIIELVRRIKVIGAICEAGSALSVLFKATNAQNIVIPEQVFDYGNEEFEKFVAKAGELMVNDETKAGVQIQKMIETMNRENVNAIIPSLLNLRGILKRPRVKKQLQGMETKIVKVITEYLDNAEKQVDRVSLFCQNISTQSADGVLAELAKLKAEALSLKQLFQGSQILVPESQSLNNQLKDFNDTIKLKEAELVRASKQLIAVLMKAVQQVKTIMYFDEAGKLFAQLPLESDQLIRLISGLNNFGYDQKGLALPNDVVCYSETLIAARPQIVLLNQVSDFYNSLISVVKNYQKPLLMRNAQAYEAELKKVSQASAFNISVNNIKDDGLISKLAKMADYIQNVTGQFKLKIDKLDDFHRKVSLKVEQLVKLKLSQRISWIQLVDEIKAQIADLFKLVPPDLQMPILMYWTGILAKVMGTKYEQALNQDLGNIKPLSHPVVITQQMDLEPTLSDIRQYLTDQVSQIAQLPQDPNFWISDKECCSVIFTQMSELSVQFMPEALSNIEVVMSNIEQLMDWLSARCGIVSTAYNKNEELIMETLPDFESVNMLLEAYESSTSQPQITELSIVSELPFLIEKTNEKGIYMVQPSGGAVCIDLATAMRLLAMRQNATLEVAVLAAVFHAKKISESIIGKVEGYNTKLQSNLSDINTSDGFSQMAQYFINTSKEVNSTIRGDYDHLMKFKSVVEKSQHPRDMELKQIQAAVVSYNTLLQTLKDTNKIMETKKKDMWDGFKQQLVGNDGVFGVCAKVVNLFQGIMDDFDLYCQKQIIIKTPVGADEANLMFRNLTLKLNDCSKMSGQLQNIDEQLVLAEQQLTNIDKEVNILFEKNYQALCEGNNAPLATINQGLDILQVTKIVTPLIKVTSEVEELLKQYLTMEWQVAKVRFDLLDQIVTKTEDVVKKTLPELKGQLKNVVDTEKVQLIDKIITNTGRYIQMIYKLCNQAHVVFKQLKSPALNKQHWQELADKIGLISACKYFQQDVQGIVSQLPDVVNICSFLYVIAAPLFPTAAAVGSDGLSNEYKKFQVQLKEIINKAENELAVRSAVEEITYWLQSEAKVSFSTIELSQLSLTELQQVFSGRVLPLTAGWRPIFTALTEKKAILASVLANPYSKFLKEQIEESSCAIEALTRFAQIMGTIQKQITVLEPVMGRKVLPDQHKRFYNALRSVAFGITSQLEDSIKQQLTGNVASITIGCQQIIGTKIKDSYKLQYVGKQQLNVDNSALGRFTDTILAFEAASSHLSEVQLALRQYLEAKRLTFSRFYFLADQDVLEILANANSQPQKALSPHIKKLFSCVEKLDFQQKGSGFEIVSFWSSEGEKVDLKCKVTIDNMSAPELWLNKLDLAMKETLKVECLAGLGITEFKYHDVNQLTLNDHFDINQSYATVKSSVNPFQLTDQFFNLYDLQQCLKKNLDINQCSGEVLTVIFAILFTIQVDDVIYRIKDSNQQQQQLDQLLQKQTATLKQYTDQLFQPQISTATFGSNEYVINLKLKALSTDITHYITVLNQLISDPENRLWLWNKEIKCRLHKKSGDAYFVSLDTFLPYTYEYQGLYVRLIHTPLTDRCFSTLISALNCGKSSNPQGPAGTGKTETVKAFAAKIARPCIVFNCDSAIDRENLSRILIGIVLSGSMGCFDEVNRLSPAVLSAVSTDIENIQVAIQKRSTCLDLNQLQGQTLSLSDITVPIAKVSPFSAVFVTMNPASREYRGRSELPYSLIRLLRGCFMGRADISLIMEVILQTSGFVAARQWAEKSELTYLLASRRIPKEVHLDWGLRSLQSVLRQAALARASICRKQQNFSSDANMQMERGVIIKALSDATFSRIQNRSADIFKEILGDIFGKIDFSSAQKFGAASETEIQLVQHFDTDSEKFGNLILQFYRALTAKLGVSLLGKTASGKSTIRQLLKQAIQKASLGFIEIREYVIAPKSMSRQDLLGFVDPVTKEWNDGALTKAARTAVQLLQNREKPYVWPWIVFDGSIDPEWIEALNSSLDDNRLLSLSSGERVRFPMSLDPMDAFYSTIHSKNLDPNSLKGVDFYIPTPVSFIFETDSLSHASPATVSRLAVILVADPSEQEQIEMIRKQHVQLSNIVTKLPKELANKLAEVTTHMYLSGKGEVAKTKREDCFAAGAIRCLDAEVKDKLRDSDYQDYAMCMGSSVNLLESNVSPAHVEKTSAQPAQQVWAIRLIQGFLYNGSSVLVSGERQTGKNFCIIAAAEAKDYYQIVSLSCTQLTTREDISRLLLAQCIETQRADGQKEIKPKSGKKLLVILRDIDVALLDEYGHSQLFTLLWSIVGHNKIYVKQGNSLQLQNIQFACTVTDESSVPSRLKRLMGFIKLRPMQAEDYEYILGKFYKYQADLLKQTSFTKWLQQAVTDAETQKLRAQSINVKNIICLPNTLPFMRQIDLTSLIILSQKNYNPEQLSVMVSYFLEQQVPYQQGRNAAHQDIGGSISKEFGQNVFTYARAGQTASTVHKAVQHDEPINLGQLKVDFVSVKVRLNMLNELLNSIQDTFPGLKLFNNFINNSPLNIQQQYIQIIGALEQSFVLAGGVMLLSQPNNFGIECGIIAALTTGHDIRFVGCDAPNSSVIKGLAERVAIGFRNICLVIDSVVLEHDQQWLSLIAAIASKDVGQIRCRLGLADLRALISIYSEKVDTGDKTEEELNQQFLELFVQSITPLLVLNPERPISDQIVTIAPPIRRKYHIISLPIQQSNAEMNPNMPVVFKSLMKDFQHGKIEIEIFKGIQRYYQEFEPEGVIMHSNQFIRIFELFYLFKQSWQQSVQQKQERLSQGLGQLQAAQKEVDGLAKEAQKSQEIVSKAKKEANEALVLITAKMETVTAKKKDAGEMESQLISDEKVINIEKDDAEAQLATVQPLIDEANKAVKSIPLDAISELKTFNSPPQTVQIVMEAVCLLMGHNDTSWAGIKKFMSQQGVTQKIAQLEIKNVSGPVLKKTGDFFNKNEQFFDPALVKKSSNAAAPMAVWVKANIQYVQIFTKVEPLIEKCKTASAKLDVLRKQLKETKDLVIRLENEAKELRNNFDKKTQEQMKYEAELKVIADKQKRGEELLSGLANEKVRWASNEKQAIEQLLKIEQCALSASLMMIMTGSKTDDARQHFVGDKDRSLIGELLYTPQFQDKVQKEGLRTSLQSLENASLLQYMQDQKGFLGYVISYVTDSTGFMDYVRKSVKNAQFVSATSDNLTNLISIAARFGQTIVVTDCDQGQIPAALVPYLRYGYEAYRVSESATINSDDSAVLDYSLITPDTTLMIPAASNKITEVNTNFRVFIISSVKLVVPSDLSSRIVELSFAPTEKSRTDLYMDQVLSQWSPETLTKIQELRVTQAELRGQLFEIEDLLLNTLKQSAQSKVNVLQDENLNAVLKKANQQSQEIVKAQQAAEKAAKELETLKQKATAIAENVGRCVVALEAISNLNDLYIVDDSAVIPLLVEILQNLKHMQTPTEKITDAMVQQTNQQFLNAMYRRLSAMVFTQDKVGSIAILLKQCVPQQFTQQLFDFFTGQLPPDQSINVPAWGAKYETSFRLVMSALGRDALSIIQFESPQHWSGFAQKACVAKEYHTSILPDTCASLNAVQKAALIVAVRPDLLSQALQLACDELLAMKGQPSLNPIDQALKLAQGMTQPIIIYTAAGQDPTSSLNGEILALAPGREAEADAHLLSIFESFGSKQGVKHYVIVKGAHLCLQWLSVLPSKLNEYQNTFNQKFDKNFADSVRLLLLLEPKLGFPQGLSRISWRICLQQSHSPRDSMSTIVREWPDVSMFESKLKPVYYGIMYVVSALHTTLEGRKAFAPRGVANDPGWSAMDPITVGEMISKVLSFPIIDPKIFVERIKGICVDTIYGVSTKDIQDFVLCKKLVDIAFHKDLVDSIMQVGTKQFKPSQDLQTNLQNLSNANDFIKLCDQFPALKYFVPPFDQLQQSDKEIKNGILSYVQKTFSNKPSGDQLALPSSALLTKGEKDSLLTKSIIQRAGSITGASASADLYSAILKLKELFDRIEPKFQEQLSSVNNILIKGRAAPLAEELKSQIDVLKKIVKTIGLDLRDAQFASENFLLASLITKATARLISASIIPEPWALGFLAPPTSMAPVMNPELTTLSPGNPETFINLLPVSLAALIRAIKSCEAAGTGSQLIELELSLFPRPPAVLEAIRRYEGICQGIELNNVSLEAKLGVQPTSKYSAICIVANQLQLNGAGFGAGLDFSLQQSNLPALTIVAKSGASKGVNVPIYLDKMRELRLPVVENVQVETSGANADASVSLFGVYVSLVGR